MAKRSLFLCILVSSVLSGFAQSKLSPFSRIELLKRESLAKTDSAAMATRTIETTQTDYISAYIHYQKSSVISRLQEKGVIINLKFRDFVTAQIPIDKIDEVLALDDIRYIEFSSPIEKTMDNARKASHIDGIHTGIDLPTAYTGKDVVVGIVDQGFEYAHPQLFTADGTTYRVKRVWDQVSSAGTPPEGFTVKGSEFTTPEEIFVQQRDSTGDTHGMHVAGIAAGGSYACNYQGVATESDIVLISASPSRGGGIELLEGVAYVFQYADQVNKPAVVNLSWGSAVGPRDGSSTFDKAIEELVGEGRIVVGSSGNDGRNNVHISKTFLNNLDTLGTFMHLYSSNPTRDRKLVA